MWFPCFYYWWWTHGFPHWSDWSLPRGLDIIKHLAKLMWHAWLGANYDWNIIVTASLLSSLKCCNFQAWMRKIQKYHHSLRLWRIWRELVILKDTLLQWLNRLGGLSPVCCFICLLVINMHCFENQNRISDYSRGWIIESCII